MGETIGSYRVLSELGRGGMGVVLKAYDDALDRPVAIKVLGEHIAGEPSYVARFLREAQNAAKLNHPNIVQIYFIGEDHGRHYFVMEFVEGKSLQTIIRNEQRLEPARATELIRQAAAGLAAAHDRGVIHRDIKPANLILCDDGRVKIADFGLAYMPEGGARLTATGSILGTPGYLSPEQCMAETLDRRTDIYSLGISYYEMLSGMMPFKADSPFAMVHKVVTTTPPDVSSVNPLVGSDIAGILKRMIAKKREERYDDCHALLRDLDAYLAKKGYPVHVGDRPTPVKLPTDGVVIGGGAGHDEATQAGFAGLGDDDRTINLQSGASGAAAKAPAMAAAAAGAASPSLAFAVSGASVVETLGPTVASEASPALREQQSLVATPVSSQAVASQSSMALGVPESGTRRSMAPLLIAAGLLVFVLGGAAIAGFLFLKLDPLHLFSKPDSVAAASTSAALPGAVPAGAEGDAKTAGIAPIGIGDHAPAGDAGTGTESTATTTTTDASGGVEVVTTRGDGSAGGPPEAVLVPPVGGEASDGGASVRRGAGVTAASAAGSAAHASGSGGRIAEDETVAEDSGSGAPTGHLGRSADAHGAITATREESRVAGRRASAEEFTTNRAAAARAPIPAVPRILVVAAGEPLLADAVRKHLQEELGSQGYDVPDVSNYPDIEDRLGQDGNPMATGALDSVLRARGIGVVVLARTESLGDRELNVMGRTEFAQTSRLRINTFLADGHEALGKGYSEKVEYTALTVDRKTEAVIQGLSDELGQTVKSGWSAYRSGGR